MPELPDIATYLVALEKHVVGHELRLLQVVNPFVLRSVDPGVEVLSGHRITGVRSIGKRIVLVFDGALFVVAHLMIAGRLRWRLPGAKVARTLVQARFDFAHGSLYLTEAGSKRRASLHVVRGEAALDAFDRGGLDVFRATPGQFAERLRSENHTLKRSLTDPRLFSGIGNAYSDEILHRARLSPLQLTSRLTDEAIATLHRATTDVLTEWMERLRAEAGDGFPEKVTAFREGMAVHGRFRHPCPACGAPVQRIRYADNETNYCARCQTGGRLLADRAMSRLLKQDWPRSLDDVES